MFAPNYNAPYPGHSPHFAASPHYGPPPPQSHFPPSQQQAAGNPYGRGPPPAGADPQLWSLFSAVDADGSGTISVHELKQALMNGNYTQFDIDTVKMLMSIFDTDHNGMMNFEEFARLWKYVSDWQNVFRRFDRDHSGSIEGFELAEALRNFGYSLTPQLLMLVQHKYASAPVTGHGPPPGITFDRFLRACTFVKSVTDDFQQMDTDRDGWAQISYPQLMEICLRAP